MANLVDSVLDSAKQLQQSSEAAHKQANAEVHAMPQAMGCQMTSSTLNPNAGTNTGASQQAGYPIAEAILLNGSAPTNFTKCGSPSRPIRPFPGSSPARRGISPMHMQPASPTAWAPRQPISQACPQGPCGISPTISATHRDALGVGTRASNLLNHKVDAPKPKKTKLRQRLSASLTKLLPRHRHKAPHYDTTSSLRTGTDPREPSIQGSITAAPWLLAAAALMASNKPSIAIQMFGPGSPMAGEPWATQQRQTRDAQGALAHADRARSPLHARQPRSANSTPSRQQRRRSALGLNRAEVMLQLQFTDADDQDDVEGKISGLNGRSRSPGQGCQHQGQVQSSSDGFAVSRQQQDEQPCTEASTRNTEPAAEASNSLTAPTSSEVTSVPAARPGAGLASSSLTAAAVANTAAAQIVVSEHLRSSLGPRLGRGGRALLARGEKGLQGGWDDAQVGAASSNPQQVRHAGSAQRSPAHSSASRCALSGVGAKAALALAATAAGERSRAAAEAACVGMELAPSKVRTPSVKLSMEGASHVARSKAFPAVALKLAMQQVPGPSLSRPAWADTTVSSDDTTSAGAAAAVPSCLLAKQKATPSTGIAHGTTNGEPRRPAATAANSGAAGSLPTPPHAENGSTWNRFLSNIQSSGNGIGSSGIRAAGPSKQQLISEDGFVVVAIDNRQLTSSRAKGKARGAASAPGMTHAMTHSAVEEFDVDDSIPAERNDDFNPSTQSPESGSRPRNLLKRRQGANTSTLHAAADGSSQASDAVQPKPQDDPFLASLGKVISTAAESSSLLAESRASHLETLQVQHAAFTRGINELRAQNARAAAILAAGEAAAAAAAAASYAAAIPKDTDKDSTERRASAAGAGGAMAAAATASKPRLLTPVVVPLDIPPGYTVESFGAVRVLMPVCCQLVRAGGGTLFVTSPTIYAQLQLVSQPRPDVQVVAANCGTRCKRVHGMVVATIYEPL